MAIELTYNYDGRSYELGDAWGHLAVRADDLHDYWETLMEREADDYRDPESCDDSYAFTKDQDGHEIEIVEQNRSFADDYSFLVDVDFSERIPSFPEV